MKTAALAPVDHKELLISLIENDIINGRLVYGLGLLHIDAENYHLNLSEIIFRILGYEPDNVPDEVSDSYFELVRRAAIMVPEENKTSSKELASKIYEEIQNLYFKNLRERLPF
jgi:hypothetical protein